MRKYIIACINSTELVFEQNSQSCQILSSGSDGSTPPLMVGGGGGARWVTDGNGLLVYLHSW